MNTRIPLLSSLLALCVWGCGHIAQQPLGVSDLQQGVTGGESFTSDGEGVNREVSYVSDMECPPVDTAGSNLNLGSSCSRPAFPSVAAGKSGAGGGRMTAKRSSENDEAEEMPKNGSSAAKSQVKGNPPPSASHNMHDDDDDDDDDSTMSRLSSKLRVTNKLPKLVSRSLPGVSPSMNMTSCEPRWVEWDEKRYYCCEASVDWPEEVTMQCASEPQQ